MIETPMDVLHRFPVRKSKKQKQAFREEIQSYAQSLGYRTAIEKGSLGCRNIVIGDPETAEYLVTAHYDTCAGMLFPNMVFPRNLVVLLLYQLFLVAVFIFIAYAAGSAVWIVTQQDGAASLTAILVYLLQFIGMMVGPANRHNANDNTSGVVAVLETAKSMPESHRDKVCFVLFDLEELGLIGSSAHRKRHKAATNFQTVLNMDCVGDGDEIWLFPNKKLRRNDQELDRLCDLIGRWGKKTLHVHQRGFAIYPSDQASFPRGVAIAALRRSKWVGLYYGRIHTFRDKILDYTNINILRAALITYITRHPGDHNHQEDT